MNYTLMHKDIPVADLTLDETTGSIQRIDALFRGGAPACGRLCLSWHGRPGRPQRVVGGPLHPCQPFRAAGSAGNHGSDQLQAASHPLLRPEPVDHYWIKPADSGLTWHNVNFFENPFSEDVGDALFGAPTKNEGFDFSSQTGRVTAISESAGPFWMGNAA